MSEKITRRNVVRVILGGLLGLPFVVRYFNKHKTGPRSEWKPAKFLLVSPFSPEMPDISQYEENFSETVNLKPLTLQSRVFNKLIYEISSKNELSYVKGNKLKSMANLPTSNELFTKEIHIITANDDGIVFERKITPKNKNLLALMQKDESFHPVLLCRYRQTIEGLTFEQLISTNEGSLKENTPKFVTYPVKKGDKWIQEFSVDSDLNKDGKVNMTYEVLASFTKNGGRFMRIAGTICFSMFNPEIEEATGKMLFEKKSKYRSVIRTISHFDFDLQRGITLREGKVTIVISEPSPMTGGVAVVTVTKSFEELKSIV